MQIHDAYNPRYRELTIPMNNFRRRAESLGMSLMIYNTLTRKKEKFIPIEDKVVKAYFCGPTVQDEPHIGHARAYIAFDILIRLLIYLGYEVKYIRNITDIDDKIINKAIKQGISPFEVAEKYSRAFYDAAKELKLIPPNIEPRATGHIPEIIELIEKLIEKGYAYETKSGDVYFDVTKFKEYGKLSKQKIQDLIAGARIEPGEEKKNPLDFALWKHAKPGEPSWRSPWGRGRPGWHIECSAMSMKYLGESFDIHGGGVDLIFPHHENEIAQSEAATGKKFVNYWFHVGLVTIKDEKVSKSLGNVIPIKEVLKIYDPETIRLWAIQAHYRKPLEFNWNQLHQSEKILDEIYAIIFKSEALLKKAKDGDIRGIQNIVNKYKREFLEALTDDLNTPKAISILRQLVRKVGNDLENLNKSEINFFIRNLREMGWILGLLQQSLEERIIEKKKRGKSISKIIPSEYLELGGLSEKLIELIIDIRDRLRKRKMYELADEIREELRKLGIILEDTKEGTIWKLS